MAAPQRLVVVALACLIPALDARADGPTEAEALLARLKAGDAAFDDALIRYATSGAFDVKGFDTWKYPPGYAEERLGIKEYGPRRVPFRYHEQLVVRGRDATFTRRADPTLKNGPGGSPAPYQKWGEVGDVLREVVEVGNSTPREYIYDVQ